MTCFEPPAFCFATRGLPDFFRSARSHYGRSTLPIPFGQSGKNGRAGDGAWQKPQGNGACAKQHTEGAPSLAFVGEWSAFHLASDSSSKAASLLRCSSQLRFGSLQYRQDLLRWRCQQNAPSAQSRNVFAARMMRIRRSKESQTMFSFVSFRLSYAWERRTAGLRELRMGQSGPEEQGPRP